MTMNADIVIGGTLVAASIAFLLIAGLARAASRPRPTNAAPAPALTRAPVRAPNHDLCMHAGCVNRWTASRHGWNTCTEHTDYQIPPCKICHHAPATEFGRLCLACHERIRDHFDEFVDQALAIANAPDPDDEVGEADLSLWELENGWARS